MSPHKPSRFALFFTLTALAGACVGDFKKLDPDTNGGVSTDPEGQPTSPTNQNPGTGTTDPATPTTSSTVMLTAPKDGDTVSGTVTITATAPAGTTSVEFFWDSESLGAPDTAAPFSFAWNTKTFTDGYYTLTAVATDASGNKTTSTNLVTVNVSNTQTTTPTTPTTPTPVTGTVRKVPADYSTIQAAVDAASAGDTIIVSPGSYSGGINISKPVTLASEFRTSNDASKIDSTTLSGGTPIINITSSAADTSVIGFTFKSGNKGVVASARVTVANNKFIGVGSDAMSLERCGGVIRDNTFTNSGDDAIDGDGPNDTLIEGNTISGSHDDGIEIRNYDYSGTLVKVIIRNNSIAGSDEDGIQLIDYPATANRMFLIERNVIRTSAMVGLGLMSGGNTVENYGGASLPERIHLFNNTFVDNNYGLTGGDNLIAVNNIFANCSNVAVKAVDNKSIVAHSLFWNNGTDHQSSNVNAATLKFADPRLSADFKLQAGSAAIDAGAATFSHNGEVVLTIPSSAISGSAPDIGRFENGK